MSLIDQLISKLAPHDCLGCGYEGCLVCDKCTARHFQPIPERCYRCRKLSRASRTCEACRRTSKLRFVRVGVVYDGLAKELVWQLKFKGAQAAANEIIKQMIGIMPESADILIIPVPTATSRVRRRGYDQAKLLARELARQSRLPYVDCLRRSGQAHQVGASRRERLRQLSSAFRVSGPELIKARQVILIDDVVTTGATLEAAAASLKRAGAFRVDAIVFAQP